MILNKWYTVVPKTVLLDDRLTDKQKLLYAEISSLCAKEGFCFATNQYFIDLGYAQNKETITRNIKELEKLDYVFIRLKKEGNRIIAREIYLSPPIDSKINTPIDSKVNDNIYNNIYSLIEEKKITSKEKDRLLKLLSSSYSEEQKETKVELEGAKLWIFGKVIADYIKDNPFFQEKVTIDEAYIDKQVNIILSLWDRFEWLGRDFNWNIPDLKVKIILTELDKLFNWYIDNKKPIRSLSGVLRNWFGKVFQR